MEKATVHGQGLSHENSMNLSGKESSGALKTKPLNVKLVEEQAEHDGQHPENVFTATALVCIMRQIQERKMNE